MLSCTSGVSAVRISDRPKVEPVCSTLLGHFPSTSNISWGGFISLPDRISNRCIFRKMVRILTGFFRGFFLPRETYLILTEFFRGLFSSRNLHNFGGTFLPRETNLILTEELKKINFNSFPAHLPLSHGASVLRQIIFQEITSLIANIKCIRIKALLSI